MKLRLLITPTAAPPRAFETTGSCCRIGRDPAGEVTLEGGGIGGVSWHHAQIDLTPAGAALKDLASTNGTFLNGQRLAAPVPLQVGDVIRLGQKGPTLRVEELSGCAALPREAVSAPAPAQDQTFMEPAPLAVLAVARPAGDDISTTRHLLLKMQVKFTAMQSRYWVAVAVAAVVAVVALAAGGWALSAHNRRLADRQKEEARLREQDEENRQRKQAEKDRQQRQEEEKRQQELAGLRRIAEETKRKLDDFAKGDASDINKRFKDAVYLVALPGKDGAVIPVGTAFAVHSSGKFATNAHVADPVKEWLGEGKEVLLIAQAGVRKYRVTGSTWHAGYEKGRRFSPDVGLLTVTLPPGETVPTVVELATREELRQLEPGALLCYIGFPAFEDNHSYESLAKVDARIYTGNLVRILTLQEEKGDFPQRFLLEHTMLSWPGASGSPIFNRQGKVVALHFAGIPVEGRRAAASVKMAMRVDLLAPLLSGR
jgi:hypothetical protein